MSAQAIGAVADEGADDTFIYAVANYGLPAAGQGTRRA